MLSSKISDQYFAKSNGALDKFKEIKNIENRTLEDIKYSTDLEDKERLKLVAQEFESIFTKMVFKGMEKTVHKGEGLFGDESFAKQTFDDMLLDERSKMVSKYHGLGLAEMIYDQYVQQLDSLSAHEIDKKL